MERLTYRIKEDVKAFCPPNVPCTVRCDECEHLDKMMNKLADYEDAEEQGKLLSVSQANEWRKAGYSHGYADAIREFAEQVIGELEVFQRSSEDDYAGLGCEDDFGAMNAYGHAIEIVKQRLACCTK